MNIFLYTRGQDAPIFRVNTVIKYSLRKDFVNRPYIHQYTIRP